MSPNQERINTPLIDGCVMRTMVDGNTYLLVFGHKRKSYLPDLINSSDRNSKNKVANSIKG
jgi:hypothetical protein